jgi:glycosyltransferase involved in cell wall biosynthesis
MADTDVVIIWVGRLVPEKRPDIWLNTVKRLFLFLLLSSLCSALYVFPSHE